LVFPFFGSPKRWGVLSFVELWFFVAHANLMGQSVFASFFGFLGCLSVPIFFPPSLSLPIMSFLSFFFLCLSQCVGHTFSWTKNPMPSESCSVCLFAEGVGRVPPFHLVLVVFSAFCLSLKSVTHLSPSGSQLLFGVNFLDQFFRGFQGIFPPPYSFFYQSNEVSFLMHF